MNKGYVAVCVLSFLLLPACAVIDHAAVDEKRPVPRLAYHEVQPPERLAHIDVQPEYYIWLCVDESTDWALDFLIAYELNEPRMILSNTWSPGFRFEHGRYQKIQVDSAFLVQGDVSIDVMFDFNNSGDTEAVGISLKKFLESDDIDEYVIDEERAFYGASAPCTVAKPLKEKHMQRSFGARIH